MFIYFFIYSFLHHLHSSYLWAFLFILLLDGLVMQPPGKSIDPPEAEVAAQTGATKSCSHLFRYWGEMEGSPYFTSCFDKLLYFVVLLFGDLFFVFSPSTCCGETGPENTVQLLVKQADIFTAFSNILSVLNCCHSCFHQSSREGKLSRAR